MEKQENLALNLLLQSVRDVVRIRELDSSKRGTNTVNPSFRFLRGQADLE